MNIGIDTLSLYVPRYYLDLGHLAAARQVPADKYRRGLGQEQMAVPPPDEDIITMAATAGLAALRGSDRSTLDRVILATESGVDQSKAGALYLHRLLELPARCQAFEVKQACCGSTVALQLALDHVRLHPTRRVLVVAADIARYELGSPGEPTQGAGAAAFVVSARPRLLACDAPTGSYTEDVMDFWRPPYRDTALVDGKFSVKMYLTALQESYQDYLAAGGVPVAQLARCCYHLPFTRMAEKAHAHLTGTAIEGDALTAIAAGMSYNRLIGNSYTASLYISLAAMLESTSEDLSGQRVGLFAYGSGCMGLFRSATVVPGYQEVLQTERHRQLLWERQPLTVADYQRFYATQLPTDGSTLSWARHATGPFRLAGITGHQRQYERVAVAEKAAPALPVPPVAAHAPVAALVSVG